MPDMTARNPPPRPDLKVLTLSTKEACERLGCSRSTLFRLWKKGKLERVRAHGAYTRVTVRSLNALIKETMTINVMRPRDTG